MKLEPGWTVTDSMAISSLAGLDSLGGEELAATVDVLGVRARRMGKDGILNSESGVEVRCFFRGSEVVSNGRLSIGMVRRGSNGVMIW